MSEYAATTNLLCDDGSLWLEEVNPQGRATYRHVSPERSAIFFSGGDSPTILGGAEREARVRRQAEDTFNSLMRITDPGKYLPLRESHHRPGICTIHELARPAAGESGLWKVAYSWRAPGQEVQRLEIELDPAVDWRVVRFDYSSPTGRLTSCAREIGYQTLCRTIVPTHASALSHYRHGKTYAEEQTWSPLTDEEQEALKERVEKAARMGPVGHESPYVWMRRLLMAAVVGCPVMGGLLVGVRRSESV